MGYLKDKWNQFTGWVKKTFTSGPKTSTFNSSSNDSSSRDYSYSSGYNNDTTSYYNNLHTKVSQYQARQKVHIDEYEEKINAVFKEMYEPIITSLKNLNNNVIDIKSIADFVEKKSKTFKSIMTNHVNGRINVNDSDFLSVYYKTDSDINEFCKKVVTESEKIILQHFNDTLIDVNNFIRLQINNEKDKWSTKIEHTTKQLKQLNGSKEEQDKAIMNIESIFLHLDLIAETLSIAEDQITKPNKQ